MSKNLLAEAERLHALGFAVHWLRPKSKIPVNGGWTKGPRLTLKDLRASYKDGYNVGVRLGAVSEVKKASLGVIDLDVKSELHKHRREAEKELERIFPSVAKMPCIESGRGNGSAHYYVRLKEATRGNETKAKSKETVKVLMPSVKPSKTEEETLSFEDLEEGFRLRPAWEISLLSEGRQTVLAGSIHPDSGAKYAWRRQLGSADDIPLLKSPPKPSEGSDESTSRPEVKDRSERRFEFKEVDAEDLGLKPDQVSAIVDGKGVSDRSAKIYELTLAMLSRGIDHDTIVSVFTNKEYYLGGVAYEHAKTKKRAVAARWVDRYSLRKADAKVNGTDFDIEELPEGEVRRERDRERYAEEETARGKTLIWPVGVTENPLSWERELELRFRGKRMQPLVKPTYGNLRLILANVCETPNFIAYDEFAQRAYYVVDTPWGNKKGEQRSAGNEDALKVKAWLHEKYEMEPAIGRVEELINTIVVHSGFHPLKEYLENLTWDGIPRISTAFKRYMGATMPEPYLSEVSRKFFLGAVTRVFEPGSRFQYMLVLEGEQGIGKSTFLETLASKAFYLDGLPDFKDKDAVVNLVGTWICEIGELAALARSDSETAKQFISKNTDKIRPPYGVRRVEYPRSSVFAGTTNKKEYLRDPTGNRRYWPVWCVRCDFEGIIKDRDQLWAEAVFRYNFTPERLFLEGKANRQAVVIQALRRADDEADVMLHALRAWELEQDDEELETEKTLSEFFNGPWANFAPIKGNLMRAGAVLSQYGYTKRHSRRGNLWSKIRA